MTGGWTNFGVFGGIKTEVNIINDTSKNHPLPTAQYLWMKFVAQIFVPKSPQIFCGFPAYLTAPLKPTLVKSVTTLDIMCGTRQRDRTGITGIYRRRIIKLGLSQAVHIRRIITGGFLLL